MLLKIGFVILICLFGALMFVAGTLAPEGVRAPIVALTGSGASANAVSAAAGLKPAAPPSDKKLPNLSSLLLPAADPAQANYGLQAGLFPNVEDATALIGKMEALGFAATPLDVLDANGAPWVLVAVGNYADLEKAQAAQPSLVRALNLSGPPAMVVLPK